MADVKALEDWLTSIQPLETITSEHYDALMKLCVDGSPLWALIGLLLGKRQEQMLLLANQHLGDPSMIAAASVIQGHIRGIDETRQVLLGLAKQAAEKVPEQQRRNS